MTIDEFFVELYKSGLKFYALDLDDASGRKPIRIVMATNSHRYYCCPITALLLYKTGRPTNISLHRSAAVALGLSERDGLHIALAADDDQDYSDIRERLEKFV